MAKQFSNKIQKQFKDGFTRTMDFLNPSTSLGQVPPVQQAAPVPQAPPVQKVQHPADKNYRNQNVIEEINYEAYQLLQGYDRWKNNEDMGVDYLNKIHELTEESRTSSKPKDLQKFQELFKVLDIIIVNFKGVIKDVIAIQSQIENALTAQGDLPPIENDPVIKKLESMENLIIRLRLSYENNLATKTKVMRDIANTTSSLQSHALIAKFQFSDNAFDIVKLITQLKVAKPECAWEV